MDCISSEGSGSKIFCIVCIDIYQQPFCFAFKGHIDEHDDEHGPIKHPMALYSYKEITPYW